MNCNCSVGNSILAVLIIVFAIWQIKYWDWIVVIAAAVILVHSFAHKCSHGDKMKMAAPVKARRRR